MSFEIVYFTSLVICLLTSWAFQLIGDDGPDKVFGLFGFIPGLNVLFAALGVILFVGWIGITIAFLPTYIKSLIKK